MTDPEQAGRAILTQIFDELTDLRAAVDSQAWRCTAAECAIVLALRGKGAGATREEIEAVIDRRLRVLSPDAPDPMNDPATLERMRLQRHFVTQMVQELLEQLSGEA